MLPCSNCGELIAEDTTVCPHCDTFAPLTGSSRGFTSDQEVAGQTVQQGGIARYCFRCRQPLTDEVALCPQCGSPVQPEHAPDPANTGTPLTEATPPHHAPPVPANTDRTSVSDPAQYAGRGRPAGPGGWLALGGAGLLVRVLALVAAACVILGAFGLCAILGDGASSGTEWGEYECQALYDEFAGDHRESDIDGLEILSIAPMRRTDTFEWNKRVCPAVVETPEGRYTSWIYVTGESETEWEFEFRSEPIETTPAPEATPPK